MPGDLNYVLFNVEKLYSVYFSLVKNATSILFGHSFCVLVFFQSKVNCYSFNTFPRIIL